jgi:hypothetical protein
MHDQDFRGVEIVKMLHPPEISKPLTAAIAVKNVDLQPTV